MRCPGIHTAGTSARAAALVAVLLACQACTAADAVGDESTPPSAAADARFSMSGVLEGEREGVAWVKPGEYSRGHLFDIHIADSREEAEQSYNLMFRAESVDGGIPVPGSYPIVDRADPAQGHAGGMSASFTDILENRGMRYAHLALEYTPQPAWKAHDLGGTLIIDSVEGGVMTGTFEMALMENASINDAPRRDEKRLRIHSGRFSVPLPADPGGGTSQGP